MQQAQKILTKSVLGFGLVLLLSGCLGSNTQEITVSAKPIDKPNLTLPPVDEIRLRPVEWVIINEQNINEKIAQLTADGKPFGLFVLTGEGYENLGMNFSDIRALVQQQKEIILAYERYYKKAEEAMDGAVQAQ